MDSYPWPELPPTLRPHHAYGVLEIRAGEITEEDRQTMEPEDLETMPQEGDVRHAMLARVDLRTGHMRTEHYLSRDQYDWGIDTIVFRPYRSEIEIDVEEGQQSAFAVDEDELEEAALAWQAYLAGEQNQALEANTAQAGAGRTGPRL